MTSASAGTKYGCCFRCATFRPGLRNLVKPVLRYRRDLLADEADQADQHAAWIEGYLLRFGGFLQAFSG